MANLKIRSDVLACLFLVLATVAVYWQVGNHGFVNLDDPAYVAENHFVRGGLTGKGIAWSFSFEEKEKTYWHPLTWLSHMLDCQIYGLRPGPHHLTNLILHIANSLLLFLVLKRMTGAHWKSAFVAALFALHPLNVDSVAWIAERKNVLSTFFWILTILCYVRYTERPGFSRYMLTFFVFALGLLAKPMLVTLPAVFLLLDYWPLGRFRFGKSEGLAPSQLIIEKIPFLVLSIGSVFISTLSLSRYDGTISTEIVSMKLRIANALVSYVCYVGKMLWPSDLAVFYPYPQTVPVWQVTGAAALLACITALVFWAWRSKPYFLTGWLWFFGTLIPVSGLMQTGLWPAIADRWSYVPLIGLFIMIAWGVPPILGRWRYRKTVLVLSSGMILLVIILCARLQVSYWKDSASLFTHALNVTSNNYLAHYLIGIELEEQGDLRSAISHYFEALRITPNSPKVHSNLGLALATHGRIDEAIPHFLKALRIKPNDPKVHSNFGLALATHGRIDEAIPHFSRALRIKPKDADLHNNMGNALASIGRMEAAIGHWSEALRLRPDNADVHNNMGIARARQGRLDEAISHFKKALQINPEDNRIRENLARTLRLSTSPSRTQNGPER